MRVRLSPACRRQRKPAAEGSAAALRTALFTPALRMYVSLRDVIPGRDDKINSKRRSLQIAARASVRSSPKSLANLPRVSRAFESLPETGRARTRARGGWVSEGEAGKNGAEGGRIYLNILGNLGTRHAPAGVISSPHATRRERAANRGGAQGEALFIFIRN